MAEAEGDVRAAEEWYAKGLAQVPTSPDLLFARAQFYARHQGWEKAKADLLAAMRYETRDGELHKIKRALEALSAR